MLHKMEYFCYVFIISMRSKQQYMKLKMVWEIDELKNVYFEEEKKNIKDIEYRLYD